MRLRILGFSAILLAGMPVSGGGDLFPLVVPKLRLEVPSPVREQQTVAITVPLSSLNEEVGCTIPDRRPCQRFHT